MSTTIAPEGSHMPGVRPAAALPDYAPIPKSALGPALNEQGYTARPRLGFVGPCLRQRTDPLKTTCQPQLPP